MIAKGLIGVGAGVFSDFVVEFFRIPLLNDVGMFGNTDKSNFEVISYAISAGGVSAGIIDYFTNTQPLGFSKDIMPFLIGYGFGIGQYEGWIANTLGLRSFDPYAFVYSNVPKLF